MAYKIIRPRHGIKSLWNTYKSRIYKLGEMLVESPESGVGSGPVNIKFGDGVTDYEKLPYAVLAPVDEVSEGVDNPPTSNAVFQCVSKFKAKIASAITDMGVETDATASADTMAANIRNIETGVDTSDATATAADIIKEKTAYVNGEKLTGSYDFASKTSATAAAANIASGKTAWVNGSKLTGTLTLKSLCPATYTSVYHGDMNDQALGYTYTAPSAGIYVGLASGRNTATATTNGTQLFAGHSNHSSKGFHAEFVVANLAAGNTISLKAEWGTGFMQVWKVT